MFHRLGNRELFLGRISNEIFYRLLLTFEKKVRVYYIRFFIYFFKFVIHTFYCVYRLNGTSVTAIDS